MVEVELSIIIPAYNEEDSIEAAVKNIHSTNPESKVIIVDDGSVDSTGRVAQMLDVIVVKHSKNKGYGAAIKTGLKKAKTKYVAFLDADLTYDPKHIQKFLRHAEDEGLDCVWGNRFGGSINKMPSIRKIGNRVISLIFFLTTLKKISDCASGERLLRKSALKRLDLDTLPNDLDFITALTKRIVVRGLKYKEIPIDYGEREGHSKLNIFRHGYKMIKNVIFVR